MAPPEAEGEGGGAEVESSSDDDSSYPLSCHFDGEESPGQTAHDPECGGGAGDRQGGQDNASAPHGAAAEKELEAALAKRRSKLEECAQTFESRPAASKADASHLEGLSFDAPPLQRWLLQYKDPEEDRRGEFFAEGLRKRGPAPAHAPPGPARPEDAAKLSELARAIDCLRRQVDAERAQLGGVREEVRRREEELKARERALEVEREEQRRREEEVKNYPRPAWLEKSLGTINIGVVGNSGVGKSLLINRLRGLQPGAPGWAPVGVKETTKAVSMYAFPMAKRVRLWDFPGAGTQAFPLKTYIARMGLRYLDSVIIVTAGRFTETEIELMEELSRHSIPYLMVRTKVDIDISNNRLDNGIEERATKCQIIADLQSNKRVVHPYLVSLRDPSAHDFPKLVKDVFPCLAQGPSGLGMGWDDAWSMPVVLSQAATAIQGRWTDGQGHAYFVQGLQVHATCLADGRCTVVLLSDEDGKVWWQGRWFVDSQSAMRARVTGELRWSTTDFRLLKPVVWRWND